MVELISTPLLVTLILGVAGLVIPVIDAIKKERGSNNRLYSGIAFGALIVTIGIVIFRVLFGEVTPAVLFSKGVIADDLFGSFFAISLLIVSIMVAASSWNYMRGRVNPAPYYSLILLSSIGMVLIGYSTDLVMLLVAWELMSIPTYALASIFQTRSYLKRGSYKILYVRCTIFCNSSFCHRPCLWHYWDNQHRRIDPRNGQSSERSCSSRSHCNRIIYCWLWIQNGPCTIPHVAARCV